MTHPLSTDQLLNTLLSDEALGQGLTSEDKLAVREMFGELVGELGGLTAAEAVPNPTTGADLHPAWRRGLRSLLLHEFNFINTLARWLTR